MDRQELRIDLKHKLEESLTNFENFISIDLSLAPNSKPMRIINGLRFIPSMKQEFVLSYAADPRRKNDKVFFEVLQKSKQFDSYQESTFGHDGLSWSKGFGLNIQEIISEILNIHSILKAQGLDAEIDLKNPSFQLNSYF